MNLKTGVSRESSPHFPNTNISYHLHTYVCVSGGKKCSFFGNFGVLCFLETPVLRFALLPYYQRHHSHKKLGCFPSVLVSNIKHTHGKLNKFYQVCEYLFKVMKKRLKVIWILIWMCSYSLQRKLQTSIDFFYALVVDFAHILDNIPHIGLVHPIIMLDMC